MSIDTMNEAVGEAVDTVADLGTNVAQGRHVPRRGQWRNLQQVRGRIREAKGALTDSNQDHFYGRRDQLSGYAAGMQLHSGYRLSIFSMSLSAKRYWQKQRLKRKLFRPKVLDSWMDRSRARGCW